MLQLLFALTAFTLVGIKLYKEFTKDILLPNKRVRVFAEDAELDGYLRQIAFYIKLNPEDRATFRERIKFMLEHKQFQGMDGLSMTNEIRTIVAASAVQVSFKLDNWKFPSFQTFRIYPESFYSQILRKYLKGGAGHTGQIWFSLQDYRDGYANPENGINLGLHEMAHALVIEMKNGNLDDEYSNAYDVLEKLAADRIPKIRHHEFTFLRDYAGTNEMEFIAVCTEYFFEQPNQFRAADRELYDAISALYRQQLHKPETSSTIIPVDYAQEEQQPRRRKNYRYARWHWSLTLVLLGIFIAPVALIAEIRNITLPGDIIAIIAIACFFISGVFLYFPIVRSQALGLTQFVLCHLFGLGPFVFMVLLILNNHIPVWRSSEAHVIKELYYETRTEAIASLTDNAYSNDRYFRYVDTTSVGHIRPGDVLIIVKQYGILGIPVYGTNLVAKQP